MLVSLLCILVEPLRHLHLYFLKLAHAQVNYDKRPRIMDEISPVHSVVHQTLQYYSSLLAGHGSRLALLWAQFRCQSFGELLSESPMLARRYKRGVLCIVGWLQRRVWLVMADWPWLLYGLADDRRTLERKPLVDKFFSTGACCKPAGLARDLQEGGASKQELLGAPVRSFLLGCAHVTEISIACVERCHAVDRRLSHPRMPWHVFAALSCNAHRREYHRAVLTHNSRVHLVDDETAELATPVPPGIPALPKSRRRAYSALQLFRFQWLSQQMRLQRNVNPCSATSWAACSKDFAALPAHEACGLGRRMVGNVNICYIDTAAERVEGKFRLRMKESEKAVFTRCTQYVLICNQSGYRLNSKSFIIL
jgi:hypothetical protein